MDCAMGVDYLVLTGLLGENLVCDAVFFADIFACSALTGGIGLAPCVFQALAIYGLCLGLGLTGFMQDCFLMKCTADSSTLRPLIRPEATGLEGDECAVVY